MSTTRNIPDESGTAAAVPGPVWRIAAIVFPLFICLFGLTMFGGGVWLIAVGGSWY